MVTPLPKIHNSKFPLFERLLSESRKHQTKEPNNNLVCPATAPVVFHMEPSRSRDTQGDQVHTESEDKEVHSPIVLQDPPKSKLKRQLSIDTQDRTEALLIRKKALVEKEDSCAEGDEVDGDQRNLRLETTHESPRTVTESKLVKVSSRTLHVEPETITDTCKGLAFHVRLPSSNPVDRKRHTDTVYEDTEFRDQRSPNRFNLNDIGLTSPFATLTPKSEKAKDREVFVFPEQPQHRKPSPYRSFREENIESSQPTERCSYTNKSPRDERKDPIEQSPEKTISAREPDAQASCSSSTQSLSHISPRGFVWPDTVTVYDRIPFSPRIVTASTKPKFPSSSISPKTKSSYEQFEEDRERLRMLEREYARAKAFYGSPPPHSERTQCPVSPTQRSVDILRRGTLRSFSDIDRSPNEKDIKETNEDVRNRYERSFSDPRFSPRQISGLLQRPSPLAKPYEGQPPDTSSVQSRDKYRDPFREDVRRRLFMKSDNMYDYRRQQSSHSYLSHGSMDIPEEVLHFLHSRNFHPEELENLKEVLRRGGSPNDDSGGYFPQTTAYYDTGRNEEDRYGHHLQHRMSLRDELHEPVLRRERRPGEIDVRLACEEIFEKKRTEEILRELDHDGKNCKCAQIEKEIWNMAMDAYSKIRRANRSAEAHDQFQTELHETHNNIYTSMRVLCGIKCLCKYGRTLEEVFPGSVVFRLRCPNTDALLDLWHAYKTGTLLRQLTDAFVCEELLDKFECNNIKLKVTIDWKDYLDCKKELESLTDSGVVLTPTKSPLTPIHCRSRSEPASVTKQANQILQPKNNLSPFRERILSDSSVELSPRRAFQELNADKQVFQPQSSGKKLVSDSVFVEDPGRGQRSPLTPSRRKTFVFEAQNEQENVNSR